MREILFRAICKDTGTWVEGYYFKNINSHIIIGLDGLYYTILPETLGEYTGMTDKKCMRIFEGDILEGIFPTSKGMKKRHTVAVWSSRLAGFVAHMVDGLRERYYFDNLEVIGNIHDNPELLGGDT